MELRIGFSWGPGMNAGATLLIKNPAECQYFPGSFIFTLKAQVERVVLNALAKQLRPCRLIICAFGDYILPSVRAGLAFSGEVDPPLATAPGGTRCSQRVGKATAALPPDHLRLRRLHFAIAFGEVDPP